MKKKRLPAAFVVTVSALAGTGAATSACHTEEPIHGNPPADPQWNPPPPPSDVTQPVEAGVAADASDAERESVHWNPPPPRPTVTLNATDAKTKLPILKTETGCEVNPGLGSMPGRGVQPAPSHPVKCPAAMKDPAWAACLRGTLETTSTVDADGGAVCACNNHGNPPMVKNIPCPPLP